MGHEGDPLRAKFDEYVRRMPDRKDRAEDRQISSTDMLLRFLVEATFRLEAATTRLEKLTRWLVGLTVVLVGLTVVLGFLALVPLIVAVEGGSMVLRNFAGFLNWFAALLHAVTGK